MSTKAEKRAAAAKVLREAGAEDGLPPEGLAVISLFTDMLESLDRIAAALEYRRDQGGHIQHSAPPPPPYPPQPD